MTGFGNSNAYSETQGKAGVGWVVIMKEEHAWVFYSGVERMDSVSLGSKNEHSLTSTKIVKNLWLVTIQTYFCITLTRLLPLPFPPKIKSCQGKTYALNEFTGKTLNLSRTVRISCSNDACCEARPVEQIFSISKRLRTLKLEML